MQKSTKFFFAILLLILISFGKNTNAQDCTLPIAQKILQGNNITTNILNGGDLFWDRNNASFTNNSEAITPAHSIFNAGLWIGGFTGMPDNPNLKIATSSYNSSSSHDFVAGPLNEVGTTDNSTCINYDQLWEVFGFEIEQHLNDYTVDGIVDIKIPNIYAYPAHQNPHFEDIHGFTLPNTLQGLAPFWDNNNDGIYNPDHGDFPLPSSVHKDHFPEHLIWGIFNDAGANHTTSQGDLLRVEIQLTAWASSCTDNEILNNTVFTSHKIINRSQDPLDSLFAGMFVDFDIGCYYDDYVGSIPSMNTIYAYNSDPTDGESDGSCPVGMNSYASNPPVQAVTYLNHDMNSFSTTSPPSMPVGDNSAASFYNLLNGLWGDGTPISDGGNGYNSGGQNTNYLFDGNPNNPNEWSMESENIFVIGDFRTISSVEMGQLNPDQMTTIDMAYTFYQDSLLDNIETVNLVYDNTPLLQQMYDTQFENTCASFILSNENLAEDRIQIFPNPTSYILNIKLENPSLANFFIFDIYGKKVLDKREVNQSEIQLSTSTFSSGVYFLKIEMEGKELVKKFIKM